MFGSDTWTFLVLQCQGKVLSLVPVSVSLKCVNLSCALNNFDLSAIKPDLSEMVLRTLQEFLRNQNLLSAILIPLSISVS